MAGIVFTVPQGHVVIVERFGRYARHHTAGIAFRIPIIEQVKRVTEWGIDANKEHWKIEITEQQGVTEPRSTHTKDNVELRVSASVYWRITDPRSAVYEVDRLPMSIQDVALNALRSVIGTMTLDEALTNRQKINDEVSRQVTKKAASWGVNVTRVEVQELTTNDDTAQAMLQQMAAERKQRALISEAKGQAEATITVAEAERQSAILKAEGDAQALLTIAQAEAQYLQQITQVLDHDGALKLLLAQKVLTGYSVIANKPADKVFLPSSVQNMFNFDIPSKNNSGASSS